MSFSADWLAMREPADMRARAAPLLGKLRLAFAGREDIAVADLGCGTGSTVRAVAAMLPARQIWRLYDHDAALLTAARDRLSAWAQNAREEGGALRLEWYGKTLRVEFERIDLREGLAAVMAAKPDLITASALFDLVSLEWIEAFAAEAAQAGAAVYAALNYDGEEEWTPPHDADAAMLAAFHAHQRGDKGFGPAAGPDAAAHLRAAFLLREYSVESAVSPWNIGDPAMIAALAEGAAQAASETGLVTSDVIADWLAHRRKAANCVIGHEDVLAFRPKSSAA